MNQHLTANDEIELTIVMPCMNEAETIARCFETARIDLQRSDVTGEIRIADNGSTDGSQTIAEKLGARVDAVKEKGYDNAVRDGVRAVLGKWTLMGDADDSYDFSEANRFMKKFQAGDELVMGCRLPVGGGTIMPGAMPWKNRWIGNPILSFIGRLFFNYPAHDFHCGLRGFRKDFQQSLDQRCTGMEFAMEMIVKSSHRRVNLAEVPITLHPDGRKAHAPHLKTFRDGWHTLLFSSLALLFGYLAIVFALLKKTFAINEGLMLPDHRMSRFFEIVTIEKGLIAGGASLVVGLALLLGAVGKWKEVGFGLLNYSHTMRWVIPGATFTALGFQTVLSSFFASILGMNKR